MNAMTDREIQFVRGARAMGAFNRDVYEDVSDADIANGLQGSHYLARVRLSIAVEDFTLAVKDLYSRLAALMARRS